MNGVVNIEDLRKLAKKRLPKIAYDFIEGGTDDEVGLVTNEQAFRKARIVPRYLVDITTREQSTTIFGRTYSSPIGIAPTGLAGLLLASIIAVAMSNASGSLNSLAASSVLDFSALRSGSAQKPTDDRSLMGRSRRMTLFWGLVLMGFGLVAWGPLLEAGLTVASLPFGSLLGLFLLGTFNRRSNATGALAGMFAGLLTILCVWRLTTTAFTWYVLIGSCVTFLVGSLVSRLTRPGEPVNHHATVRSA